jgi:precorrin-2 dehydrogenase / sirohydrochlorin ferrochelatase
MDSFPAFFPLKGARVVIAGDGEPAAARVRLFEGSPAEVVRLEGEAAYDPEAYAGAVLIFIASFDDDFARAAAAAARDAGAPINVFDRPALSDFTTPAIVDRGAVTAAVATGGAAPLLAQALRAELEARVPAEAGETARLLGDRRDAIKQAFPDLAVRRAFLRRLLAGPPLDAATLDAAIAAGAKAVGRIVLIDLPESEDLLSLRAVRALAAADVVVAAGPALTMAARLARREAERLDAASGDRLAELAGAGKIVVVLGLQALVVDGAERLASAPETR